MCIRDRVYTETDDLEAELPHLDVLYMTRIQQERFFNEEEYLRLDVYKRQASACRTAKRWTTSTTFCAPTACGRTTVWKPRTSS